MAEGKEVQQMEHLPPLAEVVEPLTSGKRPTTSTTVCLLQLVEEGWEVELRMPLEEREDASLEILGGIHLAMAGVREHPTQEVLAALLGRPAAIQDKTEDSEQEEMVAPTRVSMQPLEQVAAAVITEEVAVEAIAFLAAQLAVEAEAEVQASLPLVVRAHLAMRLVLVH